MTLESLTHNADGVISSGGETFNVGVTLNLNSNQVLGGYTGTYSVQVNYNSLLKLLDGLGRFGDLLAALFGEQAVGQFVGAFRRVNAIRHA
jgi:hypothetical protein